MDVSVLYNTIILCNLGCCCFRIIYIPCWLICPTVPEPVGASACLWVRKVGDGWGGVYTHTHVHVEKAGLLGCKPAIKCGEGWGPSVHASTRVRVVGDALMCGLLLCQQEQQQQKSVGGVKKCVLVSSSVFGQEELWWNWAWCVGSGHSYGVHVLGLVPELVHLVAL